MCLILNYILHVSQFTQYLQNKTTKSPALDVAPMDSLSKIAKIVYNIY
jgi:hypothetical protein